MRKKQKIKDEKTKKFKCSKTVKIDGATANIHQKQDDTIYSDIYFSENGKKFRVDYNNGYLTFFRVPYNNEIIQKINKTIKKIKL